MKNEEKPRPSEAPGPEDPSRPEKKRWEPPKLAYVKPKLTDRGKLGKVTAGFFGTVPP